MNKLIEINYQTTTGEPGRAFIAFVDTTGADTKETSEKLQSALHVVRPGAHLKNWLPLQELAPGFFVIP